VCFRFCSIVDKGCDPDVQYTAWIREHYIFLLDKLDSVSSVLICYLYQHEVIDQTERDDVATEQTPAKQNRRLLSILERKSPEKIQQFFTMLDQTGQSHIKNEITGRQAGTIQDVQIILSRLLQCCLNIGRFLRPALHRKI